MAQNDYNRYDTLQPEMKMKENNYCDKSIKLKIYLLNTKLKLTFMKYLK